VSQALASGLVGFWSFNGPDMNWRYNSAYDRSSTHATGTMYNMSTTTSTVTGINGQALEFKGGPTEGKYVAFGNPASLQLGNTGTVSVWIKYSVANNFHAGIVSKNNWATDRNGYNLALSQNGDDGTISGEIADASTDNTILSTQGFGDNNWHHVVFNWDGSFLRLYVDSVSAATPVAQTLTPVSNVYDLYVGRLAYSYVRFFNGLIDEVRVYNRALSATEIQELYKAGTRKAETGKY